MEKERTTWKIWEQNNIMEQDREEAKDMNVKKSVINLKIT